MAPSHLHPDYLLPVDERRAKWRDSRLSRGKLCPDCKQVTITNDALYCKSCAKKAIHRNEYLRRAGQRKRSAAVMCPSRGREGWGCIGCTIELPAGCGGNCDKCAILWCPCLSGGMEEAA